MEFYLEQAIQSLKRTSDSLSTQLLDLPTEWFMNNDGGETWSPYDDIGLLRYGEK